MRILAYIVFIPLLFQQEYPLKNGQPTRKGIERYVEENADSLVSEFQDFVGDTLYNVWIYAEDLSRYGVYDSLELGHYFNDEIYISTSEHFIAYELDDLSLFRRARYAETNKFVKAAVMHELAHDYINQITWEMLRVDSIRVDRSYQTYIWILRSHESFGASFIQEGICEYLIGRMGEIIVPGRPFIPGTVEELTDPDNRYRVQYKYASYVLSSFLDEKGFKRGVKILLHNPPPTYEEMLNPELYFDRLVIPDF